jgi:hypothetical protein
LFARGLVRLPDHARLLRELRLLERHTHRSGKDTVNHGRNGSDDALWRQEAFRINGAAVPTPARCQMVYAVLVAGPRGDAAVVYFAVERLPTALYQDATQPSRTGSHLLILDCQVAPLAPPIFSDTVAKLREIAMATHAHGAVIFTTGSLAAEIGRLGYPAEIIDAIAANPRTPRRRGASNVVRANENRRRTRGPSVVRASRR